MFCQKVKKVEISSKNVFSRLVLMLLSGSDAPQLYPHPIWISISKHHPDPSPGPSVWCHHGRVSGRSVLSWTMCEEMRASLSFLLVSAHIFRLRNVSERLHLQPAALRERGGQTAKWRWSDSGKWCGTLLQRDGPNDLWPELTDGALSHAHSRVDRVCSRPGRVKHQNERHQVEETGRTCV